MLKIFGLGKHQKGKNQITTSIPDHLLHQNREEDGFVVVGKTTSEQEAVDSSGFDASGRFVDSIEQPPPYELSTAMGSSVLSRVPSPNDEDAAMNDQLTRYIQVRPYPENLDKNYIQNDSPMNSSRSLSRAVSQTSSTSNRIYTATSYGGGGLMDAWKDVPFQLSPKYFVLPTHGPDPVRITAINWSEFEYDFSLEKAMSQR